MEGRHCDGGVFVVERDRSLIPCEYAVESVVQERAAQKALAVVA